MNLAKWLGAATSGVVCAGVLVLGPLAPAAAEQAGAPALVEDPSCAGPIDGAPVDASVSAAPAGAGQQMSVSVPAVAMVRLDDAGAVVEAATNTGCAPRAGDAVYVVQADGSLEPAALPAVDWVGDFTQAGVFQPQG
jgi:hypothetical protein